MRFKNIILENCGRGRISALLLVGGFIAVMYLKRGELAAQVWSRQEKEVTRHLLGFLFQRCRKIQLSHSELILITFP